MYIKYHTLYSAAACGVLLAVLFWACEGQEMPAGAAGESYLTLRFTSAEAGAPTRADGGASYEEGTAYENRIDFEQDDYRVYFFTTGAPRQQENTFIARFIPEQVTAMESAEGARYTVTGKVPEALASRSAFKVVMLANWGTYADGDFTAGKTTIDDICTAEWACYDAFRTDEFTAGGGRLIPFYGVCDYKDVRFSSGQVTALQDGLALLRAVAKVEVVLDSSMASFTDVAICNYNGKGYCAPYGVYTKEQYHYDYSAATGVPGFVENPHLAGGKNDATGKRQSFKCVKERSESDMETWLAYLPEYDNSGSDYSYIEVKFDYQTAADNPYRLYFADYADDGTTDAYADTASGAYAVKAGNAREAGASNVHAERAGNVRAERAGNVRAERASALARYDIVRNNLYRFMVTLRDRVPAVNVDKWENSYDNEFDYIRVVDD
ncbi:MAG: hypothetical protein LUC23_03005 [Prevotellaceae bacterium]|nr:hypothetical protein [Prevotellaceae bacterium]